jgi:hypothetical protein
LVQGRVEVPGVSVTDRAKRGRRIEETAVSTGGGGGRKEEEMRIRTESSEEEAEVRGIRKGRKRRCRREIDKLEEVPSGSS